MVKYRGFMEGDPQLPPVESSELPAEQSVTLNLKEMTDEQIVALVEIASLSESSETTHSSIADQLGAALHDVVTADWNRGMQIVAALSESDNPRVREFGVYSLPALSVQVENLDDTVRLDRFAPLALKLSTDPRGDGLPYESFQFDVCSEAISDSTARDLLYTALEQLYQANVQLIELREQQTDQQL